jgi:hypothetical protein
MSELEQADARQQLRERVRWRLKASRRTELSKQGHPAALVNGD